MAWRTILVLPADYTSEESTSAHGRKGGVDIYHLLYMYLTGSQLYAMVIFTWLAMIVFQSWDPAAALLTWNHPESLLSLVN